MLWEIEDLSCFHPYLRQTHLHPTQKYYGHLHLVGIWSGVDLRTCAKKTCVQKRLDHVLKYANQFRLNI